MALLQLVQDECDDRSRVRKVCCPSIQNLWASHSVLFWIVCALQSLPICVLLFTSSLQSCLYMRRDVNEIITQC